MAANVEDELSNLTKEQLIERIKNLEAKKSSNHPIKKLPPLFDCDKEPKRHVLLKFLYMGWDYHGFTSQVDSPDTVEEKIFSALETCCLIGEREKSNYHRCGRTDAGVSAFTQVISIDVRSRLSNPSDKNTAEEFKYCQMLNGLLPSYIRCYGWAHVESNFSARFDCTSRSYNYYFPRGKLNIAKMQEASKYLEGTHDFRNLCKMDVGNGVTEFVRTVDSACIEPSNEDEEEEFQLMKLTIKSRGFLWHQIRCIMAVLLLVGEGNETPDIVKELLDVNENPSKPQYQMASALPLSLSEAEYENSNLKWNLSNEDIEHISEKLQGLWTEFAIKAHLVRESMRTVSQLRKCKWQRQKTLYSGKVAKIHKPLLERAKCLSLQERIDAVARKKMRLNRREQI